MIAPMQYSAPSLIASGVSPFHHPGDGRLTSTVNCPGTAGVICAEPFWPVISQLPYMSAAAAGPAIAKAITAAKSMCPLAELTTLVDIGVSSSRLNDLRFLLAPSLR